MKLKKILLLYPLMYLAKGLARLILLTCKKEIVGLKAFKKLAKEEKVILMLWHNRLSIISEILQKYASEFIYRACISKSRDAEILHLLANSYPTGRSLRIPHDARREALNQMIETVKNTHEILVITPDGPRGPKYTVKPGIAKVAFETKVKITPFSWTADRFWALSSWDNFMIPKPFSKIVIHFDAPILLKDDDLSKNCKQLELALKNLENL